MQKHQFSRITFKRTNRVKEFVLSFFFQTASLPRLIIEVFTRVDFGEQYFNRAVAFFLAAILFLIPGFVAGGGTHFELSGAVMRNPTWYLYLIAFVYFCILRDREIKSKPGTFDFARFSESLGYPHSNIEKFFIRKFGRMPNHRIYETYIEPLPFFLVGILLIVFGQLLGVLLVISAICYSVSYMAAYETDRLRTLKLIDDLICKEQTKNIIVEGKTGRDTKGVRIFADRPSTREQREKLANAILGNDEVADVI